MMTIRPSHRRLQHRLAELARSTAPLGFSTDPADADENFVARLQSLAIASSIAQAPRSTRIRRQVGAVIGAVGILGWAGAAAAGASVGLAATGNLPAPIQEVVADVLDVVKISVPRPDPLPAPEVQVPTDDGSEDGAEIESLIPDESNDDPTPETIPACGTPAAAKNPSCFERIDEETIEILSVNPACDTPAAAKNPKCQTNEDTDDSVNPACDTPAAAKNPNCQTNEDTDDTSGNSTTIPACDTPAAAKNPNCFEEADGGAIVVIPLCDTSTSSNSLKCESPTGEVPNGRGNNPKNGNGGNRFGNSGSRQS